MGKTDFRFAVFCEDIKDNVGTSPLAFVVWHVLDSSLSFLKDKSQWTGTRHCL